MQSLKQGTLSFQSAKRTSSIHNGKKAPVAEKAEDRRIESLVRAQNDARLIEALEISSDEEGATVTVPAKRTRSSTKTQTPHGRAKKAPPPPSQSEEQKPSLAEIEREHLDVEDRAGRYCRYYDEVRSKMGFMQLVHSEGQNKIHQMLRFFDVSYEFGPCIGMTRLERWERAEALGLDPPVEVRDILLTKEGIEKAEYAQCVFRDEV